LQEPCTAARRAWRSLFKDRIKLVAARSRPREAALSHSRASEIFELGETALIAQGLRSPACVRPGTHQSCTQRALFLYTEPDAQAPNQRRFASANAAWTASAAPSALIVSLSVPPPQRPRMPRAKPVRAAPRIPACRTRTATGRDSRPGDCEKGERPTARQRPAYRVLARRRRAVQKNDHGIPSPLQSRAPDRLAMTEKTLTLPSRCRSADPLVDSGRHILAQSIQ
jgi:hypothetical protein